MNTHIAINGDCLEVSKRIKSDLVNLTITSPPYFNAKDYNSETNNVGNNKDYQDYLDKMRSLIKELYRITKDGGRVCMNTSPVISEGRRFGIPFDLNRIFEEEGFFFEEDIIWRKPDGAGRLRCGGWCQNGQKPTTWHPNIVTEYIMVYRKGEVIKYERDFKKNTLLKDNKDILTNVWNINPVNVEWHDAPYPDKLVERLVLLYSFENDMIFDPFGGTLTTMKVARDLNRSSMCIELSKEYLDKAKERISFGRQQLLKELKYINIKDKETNNEYLTS